MKVGTGYHTLGGPGEPGWIGFGQHILAGVMPLETDKLTCTQIISRIYFATEGVARHYVGEGNYVGPDAFGSFYTEAWLLLNSGETFARADARPVPLVVTTQAIVGAADEVSITKVDLANGAFIWERKSLDPTHADFVVFEQTHGADYEGGIGHQYCVGMIFHPTQYHYIFEGEPFDVVLDISATGDGPCPDMEGEICLSYQFPDARTIVDEWTLGGSWEGYEDPYSVTCEGGSPVDGIKRGVFAIGYGSTSPTVAHVSVANVGCSAYATFRGYDCPADTKVFPPIAFLDQEETSCSDATIITLEPGDDCGDDGTNCGTDDECPVQYCKWQWDVDTQSWDLIESNCISPNYCPDPPDDPTVTDVAVVECNCCVIATPDCSCDDPLNFEPCDTQDCTWIWSGGTWDPLASCSDITCECHGKPDDITDPGGFVGETRDGCCCIEI
jgi:hypothetical protein